jgi:hypothetical protein
MRGVAFPGRGITPTITAAMSSTSSPSKWIAFDNPSCAAHVPPRVSVEMRALALWFA